MSARSFVEAVWGGRFADAGCWPALSHETHERAALSWWRATGLVAPAGEDAIAEAAGLELIPAELPPTVPMLILDEVALVSADPDVRPLAVFGAVGVVVLRPYVSATPADVWLVVAELQRLAQRPRRREKVNVRS